MQIRDAGDRVTLIRSVGGPVSRLRRHEVIGTFRRNGDAVPPGLLAKLTADECTSLKKRLSVDATRQSVAAHRSVFANAGAHLDELVAALDVAAEFLAPADADALWSHLAQVSRALRRAGFPKPGRTVKSPASTHDQGDLLAPLQSVLPDDHSSGARRR